MADKYLIVIANKLVIWENYSSKLRPTNLSDPWMQTTNKTFVRFGTVPPDERSFNHRDQKFEKGVSCYEAFVHGTTFVPVIPGHLDYDVMPSRLVTLSALLDKPAYQVTGTIIGSGGDDEPLLKDVVIYKHVRIAQRNNKMRLKRATA